QPWQTRFASRVEPPFSGKKASGSVCAHSARSCQPSTVSSSDVPKIGRTLPSGAAGAWACDGKGPSGSSRFHIIVPPCSPPLGTSLEELHACHLSKSSGVVLSTARHPGDLRPASHSQRTMLAA